MTSLNQDIKAPGIQKLSVSSTMLHVIAALIPGTLAYALLIDVQIIYNLLIASISGVCVEALCLILRSRPIKPAIKDCSTLLATWLLVLCIPPSLPAWQIILGATVLVTLGKQIFGGLGNNPFNPAMLAYSFLLVSFPVTMTSWHLSPESNIYNLAAFDASAPIASTSKTASNTPEYTIDGKSGATILDQLRELKRSTNTPTTTNTLPEDSPNESYDRNIPTYEIQQRITDWAVNGIYNSAWIWLTLCWLLGGLYLLYKKIISWHIPATVLLSIGSLYVVVGLFGSQLILPAGAALLTGGLFLGVFFIATDPVSAPASRQSQLIYGCGIGALTFVIREYSVYPEGFAFAILLMNMCVPLLDHLSAGKKGSTSSGMVK